MSDWAKSIPYGENEGLLLSACLAKSLSKKGIEKCMDFILESFSDGGVSVSPNTYIHTYNTLHLCRDAM